MDRGQGGVRERLVFVTLCGLKSILVTSRSIDV